MLSLSMVHYIYLSKHLTGQTIFNGHRQFNADPTLFAYDRNLFSVIRHHPHLLSPTHSPLPFTPSPPLTHSLTTHPRSLPALDCASKLHLSADQLKAQVRVYRVCVCVCLCVSHGQMLQPPSPRAGLCTFPHSPRGW